MRLCIFASALVVGGVSVSASAQSTLDYPVGDRQAYSVDSGVHTNANDAMVSVFAHTIHVENGSWIRVYFDTVKLSPDSYIRVTSKLDLETQELDMDTLRMWSFSTAYFNGDSIEVELIAGPHATGDRFVIKEIDRARIAHPAGDGSECGICGSDNRVPSSEEWTARLFPAGCTASVYNTESCLVSAGHCVSSGMVVQFNVPNSNNNCSTNNPPVADQFPILSSQSVNGGVGNDWSVLSPGTNNLGQLPYDRYGVLRPIGAAPPSNGQSVNIWGYGVDNTCTRSQTQQTSGGSITGVTGSWIEYNVDLRGGNSGSALIRNGEIIGIVTHCSFGCPNFATRVNNGAFTAARNDCTGGTGGPCGDPDAGDCCEGNGTPGCNDEECCEIICSCDPFCCDTEWDALCAGEGFEPGCGAALLCDICMGGGGPKNDDCDDALLISNGNTAFDTNGATTDGPSLPEECDEGPPLDMVDDIWYLYTATCTGTLTVSTCNQADYDTRLAAYTGPCNNLTLVGCNDDADGCGLTSSMEFTVECGQVYRIRVGGFSGSGTGTLTLTCSGTCPPPCPQDLTGDGQVNAADLANLLGAWGPCPGCPQDITGDGVVDAADLANLLGAWGPC